MSSIPVIMSWSGGKDSALALQALLADDSYDVIALISTITEGYERISMHGTRVELARRQARSLGLPLLEVRIPAACSNEVYEQRMAQAYAQPPMSECSAVAFGDLFLEDVRAYREERVCAAGKQALFPLWGTDTTLLARRFTEAFSALIVTVDLKTLDRAWAGRAYDAAFLAALPPGVDPCGENGEFHSFVHAGPIFDPDVAVVPGDVVEREGFVFCDLVPG